MGSKGRQAWCWPCARQPPLHFWGYRDIWWHFPSLYMQHIHSYSKAAAILALTLESSFSPFQSHLLLPHQKASSPPLLNASTSKETSEQVFTGWPSDLKGSPRNVQQSASSSVQAYFFPKPNQNYKNATVFATPCKLLSRLSPDRSFPSSGAYDHPAPIRAKPPPGEGRARGNF